MAFGPEPPVVGQPRARAWLAAARRQAGHAYLFVGPQHTGKRAAMRWLAAAWQCSEVAELRPCGTCANCAMIAAGSHPDVLHWALEEGDKTFKVERVRALQGALSRRPMVGRRQVHLLEDWDAVNASGANALLKALEEPPESSVLVLRAENLDAVLPTIVSRCQVVPFQLAPDWAIAQHLEEAIGVEAGLAGRLAIAAEGRPEKAIAWALAGESGPAPVAPPWPPADAVEAIAWGEARAAEGAEVQAAALAAMLASLRQAALAKGQLGESLEGLWALAKQLETARADLAGAAQARLVWERLSRILRRAGWTAA